MVAWHYLVRVDCATNQFEYCHRLAILKTGWYQPMDGINKQFMRYISTILDEEKNGDQLLHAYMRYSERLDIHVPSGLSYHFITVITEKLVHQHDRARFLGYPLSLACSG